ncbi:hypothetical protein OQA88_11923 [Cercophora sp. LCS_1]
MAQARSDTSTREPVSPSSPVSPTSSTGSQGQMQQSIWRRFFGRDKNTNDNNGVPTSPDASPKESAPEPADDRAGIIRRVSRKVVPGLPRVQTFKRQQSELRDNLEPVMQSPAERRALSVDRRMLPSGSAYSQSNPRTSAPDFLSQSYGGTSVPSLPASPVEESMLDSIGELQGFDGEEDAVDDTAHVHDAISNVDAHSITTSQYETMIHDELERIWILNLSMHFRDKSKREKFFVTYRENNALWRRVTVSLDYRDAPENSLEMDLVHTKFQRDKSAKIYEAIRESLGDIQFYDTVTNLKLQTTDGRLHVHVVEDVNEIIQYPTVRMIQHMRCRLVKERDLEFDSHLSGFVYKVRVNNEMLIKKEIPGPDTIDEFLYEINALNRLRSAENVIRFYGVVVDDREEHIKGLLISYADQGALIDIIYDHNHSLPWATREKWARQIVNGLAEIHEAGFVQGDFTLSNIVINDEGDAKIIDINRRGCPVGWEPPEATPLIESNQRISMYIGVKSDLFQLGMVLWALATQEDEPEAHGRPLRIGADVQVPLWYRQMVAICLSEDPRRRLQAVHLAAMFPELNEDGHLTTHNESSMSPDERYSRQNLGVENFGGNPPQIRGQPNDWSYLGHGHSQHLTTEDLYYYPTRGRSPPSPMPSNHGDRFGHHRRPWSDKPHTTMSDVTYSEAPTHSDGGFTTEHAHAWDSRTAENEFRVTVDSPGGASVEGMYLKPMEPSRTVRLTTTKSLSTLERDRGAGFLGANDGARNAQLSHADSGKDLSEPTATRVDRSVVVSDEAPYTKPPLGDAGGYNTSESPNKGEHLSANTRQISTNLGTATFTGTSYSNSRGTSPSTPIRDVPDDLKGIGSGCDLGAVRKQLLDDDLGIDLRGAPGDEQALSLREPGVGANPHQQAIAAATNHE